MLESSFHWANDHGCLTGDCPHENANQCVKSLATHVAQLAKEGLAAERDAKRWLWLRAHINMRQYYPDDTNRSHTDIVMEYTRPGTFETPDDLVDAAMEGDDDDQTG